MNTLTPEDILLYQEALQTMSYNEAYSFVPYPYQKDFYASGAHYSQRFLMAANRIGKTLSVSMEVSYHLTGQYPEWWEGKRFDNAILAWAIGITGDSVKNVLQKELFGTANVRDEDALGTRAIPRDVIEWELLERDGARILACGVRHVSGGLSRLVFKSTQQGQHVLMGDTVDLILLDEEDKHNSMEIYSQCLTRTMTTNGQVIVTATPENGETEMVRMFQDNTEGELYLQNSTWDDAPHLDEETKRKILAGYPSWQKDMRSKGIPILGDGLVFDCDPYKQTTTVNINNTDDILWSLDIGAVKDATVLSLMVNKSNDDECEYDFAVKQQWFLEQDEEGNNIRGPHTVATIIRDSTYPNAPLIRPADATVDSSEGYGKVLKDLGVIVYSKCAHNPPNATAASWNMTSGSERSIQTGLMNMNELMRLGKLKIDRSCSNLLREMTTYHAIQRVGKTVYGGSDHAIDSWRYGVISLLGNRGVPAGQCQKKHEDTYNNGYSGDPFN
jgi:phage terminase large subunit-like protein